MLAQIHVTIKEGVLDPQVKTVHHALNNLGYDEVMDVHIGKYLEVKLDSVSEEEAEVRVREMCERLLANTVIESFHFKLVSTCLLYTSPSPRDRQKSRMPSSA